MEIKKLVEFLALLFVIVFVLYLVFSRGKTLVDAYNDESRAYTEDLAENGKCVADHEYQHMAPMKCIRANLAVQRWWRWHAVHRVYETTYLCIDQPCGDLARGAFDSWTSLAVLTAFLVAFFLVVFGGVFRRLDQGEKFFAGRGRGGGGGGAYPHTNPYVDNGPAVMVGYDTPPSHQLQVMAGGDGLGVRQRLSTLMTGRSRVENLI